MQYGLNHAFVELANTDTLSKLRVDDPGMRALSSHLGLDTVGVWCMDSNPNLTSNSTARATVWIRDLCHGVGDPEEAASGTTNGALACVLLRAQRLRADDSHWATMTGLQGWDMGRPSRLCAAVRRQDQAIDVVKVGGGATRRLEGRLMV